MSQRPPIIYNLFPTLVGSASGWPAHASRARRMGFNWLYLNPVQYPGFSGSLYAIKEHFRLHPLVESLGSGSEIGALAPVIRSIRALGLEVMLDLVVNHASRDSPLVTAHPAWFRRDARGEIVSPSVVDPADSHKVTVWGDLAEIDNAASPDRAALWRFWESFVDRAMDLGFAGFRCDAAYKVPVELWTQLLARAKMRRPATLFVAETLGCEIHEVEALRGAGFDYIYNSSKWWDGVEAWCLEQHERFRTIAPSVSFPESHDTPRLAAETGGSEALQRQRYALAAAFSEGLQMTIGYEFGFRRALDVVKTSPADWEDPTFDVSPFVRRMNALKIRHPLFQTEGVLGRVDWGVDDVTVLRRWSDEAGTYRGFVLVNRAAEWRDVPADRAALSPTTRLYRPFRDAAPEAGEAAPDHIRLDPAEVAFLVDGP